MKFHKRRKMMKNKTKAFLKEWAKQTWDALLVLANSVLWIIAALFVMG